MLQPTNLNSITDLRTFLMALGALLWVALVAQTTHGQSFDLNATGYVPKIVVISTKDRAKYDSVIENDLAYQVSMRGRCHDKWKLKRAKIRRADGTAEFLSVNTNNRSISPDHGQAAQFVPIISSFVPPDLSYYAKHFANAGVSSPAKACNNELDRLVKQGSSRTKLLQEGFEFWAFDAYDAQLEVWCQDDHIIKDPDRRYLADLDVAAKVRCEGTGYLPPSRTTPPGQPAPKPPERTPPPPPPLTSVSVEATPAQTKGKVCPVYVNFSGEIAANRESQYGIFNTKYRFLGEHNYQSPWVMVSVNRGESRTVHGRRFIQAPKNDSGGTLLAPGGKPKVPLFNGWMMLEVALPYGTKRSERANFTVDCNPVGPKIKASSE